MVFWSVGIGVPATVAGAVATRWISGGVLVLIADLVVAGIGVRFLVFPTDPTDVVTRPFG
ncbi:MAG: hypothetical protein ACR2LJ_10455 [Acidimicrobiales bacterium]